MLAVVRLRWYSSHMRYKKPIVVAVGVGLIGATAFAITPYIPVQGDTQTVAQVDNKVEDKKSMPNEESASGIGVTLEVVNPAPLQASEPVIEPVPILSTQAYGEQYLDLSGTGQKCFDLIVARWPDRFTEDVRENNVKALAIWSGVCSTGIEMPPGSGGGTGIIYRDGINGEWFDSVLAKSHH